MLKKHELAQFFGTVEYTKWSPLFPTMTLTDGAKYVAQNGGGGGAYWLMDAIASHQPDVLKNHEEWAAGMQIWELKVENSSAVLTCKEDTGIAPVVTQEIEFTDFDLDEITFYVMPLGDGKHYVIMLTSEY